MVAEAANSTVTVMRSIGKDEYGQANAWSAVYTNVPVVFIDSLAPNSNSSSTTPTATRTVKMVAPDSIGTRADDQFLHEQTGNRYSVSSIETPPSLIGAPVDAVVNLQKITGGPL